MRAGSGSWRAWMGGARGRRSRKGSRCCATSSTGDGAGILVQIPAPFFRRESKEMGIELPPAEFYGVGMLFEFGVEEGLDCEDRLERIVAEEGQKFLGFRDVPVVPEAVGRIARSVMPRVRQFFIERRNGDEAG